LSRFIIWRWPENDAGADLRAAEIEPDPVPPAGSNSELSPPAVPPTASRSR
jgi:hypothetical protein